MSFECRIIAVVELMNYSDFYDKIYKNILIIVCGICLPVQ